MKRKAFTLCVATLVFAAMLSSCKKKENGDERITTFYATTDSEGSKTDLNGGTVLWTDGDAVKVFNADGSASATFTLSAGAGTSTGTFTGEIAESATYYGVYPNGANHSFASSKLTVNIPQTQTYRADNFSLGSATMVAQTTGTTMEFKHVCGGIAIDLVAGQAASITSIEVTALGNELLYGDFEVNSSTGAIVSSDNGGSKTTLTCSSAVALDDTDDTRFYIMLPAQTYNDGLQVVFKNGSETICTKNIGTTSGVQIPRATIKTLQQLDVNPAEPVGPVIASVSITCPNYYFFCAHTTVSSAGSSALTTVGFCWTTTESEASTVTKGTNNFFEETNPDGLTGTSFNFDLTDKTPATTYYVRSYATNSDGITTYSSDYATTITPGDPDQNLTPGNLNNAVASTAKEFTVDAAGHQVKFTKSNLAYRPSDNTWFISPNQYFLGESNQYSNNADASGVYNSTSTSYITFFGFGTSGYYANNTYFKPWDTGSTGSDINGYGYGPLSCSSYGSEEWTQRRDLTESFGYDFRKSDWGYYNSNGRYRTLTSSEFTYITSRRTDAKTKRGLATITIGTTTYYGYILLPDVFTLPSGCSWTPSSNDVAGNFSDNNYNYTTWGKMESAGAVFFPCNGYREGTTFKVSTGSSGSYCSYYWTSTHGNAGVANARRFGRGLAQDNNIGGGIAAHRGCYVRLVQDVN